MLGPWGPTYRKFGQIPAKFSEFSKIIQHFIIAQPAHDWMMHAKHNDSSVATFHRLANHVTTFQLTY
jgi:hypothetical protein